MAPQLEGGIIELAPRNAQNPYGIGATASMILSMAASLESGSSGRPPGAARNPKPLLLLVEDSGRSRWQPTSAASSRAYLLSQSSPMVPSDS
jgi:hypothetical protein